MELTIQEIGEERIILEKIFEYNRIIRLKIKQYNLILIFNIIFKIIKLYNNLNE